MTNKRPKYPSCRTPMVCPACIGRKGGTSRSDRKLAAIAINAKRGGRKPSGAKVGPTARREDGRQRRGP